MYTTAFLYDVFFYGLIAAVACQAINLLVYLMREGPRFGRKTFNVVSLERMAGQDSVPHMQRLGVSAAAKPQERRSGDERRTQPTGRFDCRETIRTLAAERMNAVRLWNPTRPCEVTSHGTAS